MSAEATFWAWKQEIKGNSKLVLLCLGDFANDANKAWCSVKTIATKCGISQRTVYSVLAELCELGLITNVGMTNRGDGKDTVIYRCNICTPANSAPLQNLQDTPAKFADKPTIYKPTNNIYISDALFDEFWEEYPRDENKKKAKDIFSKYNDDKKRMIIDDVKKRKRLHQPWQDKSFVPHATTYLNGERWNDEITGAKQHATTNTNQGNNTSRAKHNANVLEQIRARRNGNNVINVN